MMPRQNMAVWNIPEQQIFPSVKASDKPLSHQMYNGTSSSYHINSEMSTRYNLNQDDMNHLDAAFQRLRDVLPRNDALLNTSKVGIINSASEYIDLLLAEIIVLEKETAFCSDVKQTLMGDEVIGELPEPVLERVLENIEDFPIDDLLCGDAQHKVATPSYGSEIADAREIQNSDRITPVLSDGDDNGQNKNNTYRTSNGTSIDQAGRGTDGKSDAIDHGDDDDDVDVDDDSIDVGNHSDHHPGKHLKDAREENRVTSDESEDANHKATADKEEDKETMKSSAANRDAINSRSVKENEVEPRRPQNGFIRFSCRLRKFISEQHPNLDNREISRMLGAKWRRMTWEEKKPFSDEFFEEMKQRRQEFPEWNYAGNRKKYSDVNIETEPLPNRLRSRSKIRPPANIIQDSVCITEERRPRRRSVKESRPQVEKHQWVQCDRCDKWRKLPIMLCADALPEQWYCYMNPDVNYNDCIIPETYWSEDVDVRISPENQNGVNLQDVFPGSRHGESYSLAEGRDSPACSTAIAFQNTLANIFTSSSHLASARQDGPQTNGMQYLPVTTFPGADVSTFETGNGYFGSANGKIAGNDLSFTTASGNTATGHNHIPATDFHIFPRDIDNDVDKLTIGSVYVTEADVGIFVQTSKMKTPPPRDGQLNVSRSGSETSSETSFESSENSDSDSDKNHPIPWTLIKSLKDGHEGAMPGSDLNDSTGTGCHDNTITVPTSDTMESETDDSEADHEISSIYSQVWSKHREELKYWVLNGSQ